MSKYHLKKNTLQYKILENFYVKHNTSVPSFFNSSNVSKKDVTNIANLNLTEKKINEQIRTNTETPYLKDTAVENSNKSVNVKKVEKTDIITLENGPIKMEDFGEQFA